MENFEFLSQLVLRIPRFPTELVDCPLEEVLKDPVFRNALFFASDVVYEELEKASFTAPVLNDKLKYSLFRYLNRMTHRPTPFGGFASLSVIRWGDADEKTNLQIPEKSFVTLLLRPIPNDKGQMFFRVNPSLYAYGNNFRLYDTEKKATGEKEFRLIAIDGSSVPLDVMKLHGLVDRNKLFKLFKKQKISPSDTIDCLESLIDAQIIEPVSKPPVYKVISEIKSGCSNKGGAEQYASTFNHTYGKINISIQSKINQALYCLDRICVAPSNKSLVAFKREFVQLYDGLETPLLTALDPEAGIDYMRIAAAVHPEPGTFQKNRKDGIQQLFLQKMVTLNGSGTLEITDQDLEKLHPSTLPKPPSLGVLFKIIDDKIQLITAGGASSIALIGRFTVFESKVDQLALKINQAEQCCNPEVVFAEIFHEQGDRSDRINIRNQIRDYVIPVLSETNAPEAARIELNDLYLSVQNGELILRSGRLNKRVIPRLSSAYNYQNSQFPVFRFLCDLQSEGIHPGYHFRLSKLLPGLGKYSRIKYKNVIIEAATWRIEAIVFNNLYSEENVIEKFNSIARELQLPDVFIYCEHDRQLVFRRHVRSDVFLFLRTIRKKGLITVKEHIIPNTVTVTGREGGKYESEFLAFMINKRPVYEKLLSPAVAQVPPEALLDIDWQYIKIYMHRAQMDFFLSGELSEFLDKNRSGLDKWFFVRYKDPKDHLRIRFKPRKDMANTFMLALQRFMAQLLCQSGIKNITMAGYKPETERYGEIGMANAESLFHLSSEAVIKNLSLNSSEQKISGALNHLYHAFLPLQMSNLELMESLKHIYTSMQLKMKPDKQMKLSWCQQQKEIIRNLGSISETSSLAEKKYFEYLHKVLQPGKNSLEVLISLNHMHLNRYFSEEQNLKELQCYFYLYRFIAEREFKLKSV